MVLSTNSKRNLCCKNTFRIENAESDRTKTVQITRDRVFDTDSCFASSPGGLSLPLAPPSAPPSTDTSGGLDFSSISRPSVTRKAKVLYDYDAADKNELSLLADEVSCSVCLDW